MIISFVGNDNDLSNFIYIARVKFYVAKEGEKRFFNHG